MAGIDWSKLETDAVMLIGGGALGTIITTLINNHFNRRKVDAEVDKFSIDNSLLALNAALDYLKKEIIELRAENLKLKENQVRLEKCLDVLEQKYGDCENALKDKVEELEKWRKSTVKDDQFKEVQKPEEK